MQHIYFFGYGSLVNRTTHLHAPAYRARLNGWHRAWRAVPERALCYLTAVRDPQASIDGLIAPVPGENWAELDQREAAYDRHDATATLDHKSDAKEIVVYAIDPARHRAPGPDNPILLSYLDVVVAGYLSEYGPAGPACFFETTLGWEAPILDDRAAPQYSRTCALTDEIRTLTDTGLELMGSRIITAAD
ncbi:gamma-glutamylcyclotransferase [Antarctobacter heliothermus]|uniref:Gamma-glutamylcyclotransferase n=1 Tax=Antarctobacter heliothermus TaxID=74033 RepID=A0A222E1H8_9RHOB|nr:gamma-glutamylcyclotransferase [Antarctobacter heliothermus]ASP19828.1 gamma-glutamylcyclotransferase [Antarctobacter heliothermus]